MYHKEFVCVCVRERERESEPDTYLCNGQAQVSTMCTSNVCCGCVWGEGVYVGEYVSVCEWVCICVYMM